MGADHARVAPADDASDAGAGWLLAGRVAAVLLLGAGLVTITSLALPAPPGLSRDGVLGVGALGLALGVVCLLLPWRGGPQCAALPWVPVSFMLIALHNVAGGRDAYRYSIFFVVVFAWLGLFFP